MADSFRPSMSHRGSVGRCPRVGRHLSGTTPILKGMGTRKAAAALAALVLTFAGCRIQKWIDAPNGGRLYYTFLAERTEAERLAACMARLGYFDGPGWSYKLEDGGDGHFTIAARLPRAEKNRLRRDRVPIVTKLLALKECLQREGEFALVSLRFLDSKTGGKFLVLRADPYDMKEPINYREPMD